MPRKTFFRSTSRATSGAGRAGHELVRGGGLQRAPAVQDAHAVREHRGLVEVVGDEDHRHREVAAQRGELAVEDLARAAVHGRERLVEEEHARIARERPRHRHALLLAAGELGRAARFQPLQVHAVEERARARRARRRPPRARWPPRRSPARSCAGRARSSGRRSPPSARAAGATRRPRNRTRSRRPPRSAPAFARSTPAMQRSTVDLPLPEGPTSASTSPAAQASSTASAMGPACERRTSRPPRRALSHGGPSGARPWRRRPPWPRATGPSRTADMTPAAALSKDCTLS